MEPCCGEKAYKPPEMQLKAFTLVLAFQTGRSSTKLVAQGHLETEHMTASDISEDHDTDTEYSKFNF